MSRPRKERLEEGIARLTWPSGTVSYAASLPEWTDGTGRRHAPSKNFRALKDARAWRREQLGLRAKNVKRPTGRITVGDYLDDWIATYRLRRPGATGDRYFHGLQKLRTTRLWSMRLVDLEPDDVAHAYDQLAPKDLKYVHNALHKALEDARPRLIVTNPSDGGLRGRELPEPRKDVWTLEELQAFLRIALEDELFGLWWTIAGTGCRRGEALGLDWPDVDDPNVSFRRAYKPARGGYALGRLKTRNSVRTLRLDPFTAQVLEEWRRHQARFHARSTDANHRPACFTYLDGTRIGPSSALNDRFDALVERAGARPPERGGLHVLRHTHATQLLKNGASIKQVSRRLGHQDEAFTLREYVSFMPDDDDVPASVGTLLVGPVFGAAGPERPAGVPDVRAAVAGRLTR